MLAITFSWAAVSPALTAWESTPAKPALTLSAVQSVHPVLSRKEHNFCFAVWMNGKPGKRQWAGDGSGPDLKSENPRR